MKNDLESMCEAPDGLLVTFSLYDTIQIIYTWSRYDTYHDTYREYKKCLKKECQSNVVNYPNSCRDLEAIKTAHRPIHVVILFPFL